MLVRLGNSKDVAAGQVHVFDVAGTKVNVANAVGLGRELPIASAGILIDEEFGAGILRDAAENGYVMRQVRNPVPRRAVHVSKRKPHSGLP